MTLPVGRVDSQGVCRSCFARLPYNEMSVVSCSLVQSAAFVSLCSSRGCRVFGWCAVLAYRLGLLLLATVLPEVTALRPVATTAASCVCIRCVVGADRLLLPSDGMGGTAARSLVARACCCVSCVQIGIAL